MRISCDIYVTILALKLSTVAAWETFFDLNISLFNAFDIQSDPYNKNDILASEVR